MTVAQAYPWTQAPAACTMVPVWTWWVASTVLAPPDTLACAVRQTSMSVAWVPAMWHTPGTACRTQVGATAAFAKRASQVSVGKGAGLGSCPCPLLWLIHCLLLAQVPAVRLRCLPASPSHASMEASAILAKALGVH